MGPRTSSLLVALALGCAGIAGCGSETSAFDIDVGDCLNDVSGEIASVNTVSCEDPHDREVYYAFNLPDGEYPGEAAVSEAASQSCENAFSDYVGVLLDESRYGIYSLTPTQESWDVLDDRLVTCMLGAGNEKITGSAKGTGE
ncbi:MAG: septum formation family protein [Acidimicrobiales bacterium]